jgi:hypothetical protein
VGTANLMSRLLDEAAASYDEHPTHPRKDLGLSVARDLDEQ